MEVGEVKKLFSRQVTEKDWWEELIEMGLVRGKIEKSKGLETYYRLQIKKAVVPLVVEGASYKFFKFNKVYEGIYPQAFSNIRSLRDGSKIPQAVFTNEIEFNRYLREIKKSQGR